MRTANYHTHCDLDDGAGRPREYVTRARELGFAAIGFSCHSPLPFPCDWVLSERSFAEYRSEIGRLKGEGSLPEVYLALEVDYLRGVWGPRAPEVASYGLDYCVGSVHFIDIPATGEHVAIDGSAEEFARCLAEGFGGDVRSMVREYYELVREMARHSTPDVIGHIDVIKKNNPGSRYFSEEEDWYRAELRETIETVAASGAILEVNTGGLARGRTDSVYPSPWILPECLRLGIPVQINSDAHRPEKLDFYFAEARALLREAGYRKQAMLIGGAWRAEEL